MEQVRYATVSLPGERGGFVGGVVMWSRDSVCYGFTDETPARALPGAYQLRRRQLQRVAQAARRCQQEGGSVAEYMEWEMRTTRLRYFGPGTLRLREGEGMLQALSELLLLMHAVCGRPAPEPRPAAPVDGRRMESSGC